MLLRVFVDDVFEGLWGRVGAIDWLVRIQRIVKWLIEMLSDWRLSILQKGRWRRGICGLVF